MSSAYSVGKANKSNDTKQNLERTAKALPHFLLDDKKGKEGRITSIYMPSLMPAKRAPLLLLSHHTTKNRHSKGKASGQEPLTTPGEGKDRGTARTTNIHHI